MGRKKGQAACLYVKSEEQEIKGGITGAEIAAVRKNTRIGERVRVVSCKCLDFGDRRSKTKLEGAPRMATVTDTGYPHFCMVRLPSGVVDSVLWSELVLRARKKA